VKSSLVLWGIALAALAIPACGDSPAAPSTTTADATLAVVSVLPASNPILVVPCVPACVTASGGRFPFQAPVVLTILESAGVAGNVDFIDVTPVTVDGVALPTLGYGADVVTARSGTNHVAAFGSLTFGLTILYSTGSANPNLTLTIVVQFTDDLGNQITETVQVDVTA
jgi:hypothetical protein